MLRYRGKNAWYFILVFIFFNLLPLNIFLNKEIEMDTILIVSFIFYYLFDFLFIPILVRNYIDLYDDYFIFYYGFGKKKVMIKDIKIIKKSKDITASSANSLDRIYIETYGEDFMISLKNNDEFIKEVEKRRK